MRDLWFERTLILLCEHNEDGALGVVINREGDITVGEVIERLHEENEEFPDKTTDPRKTWWGGPVGDGAGFIVWDGTVENDEGWMIGERVAVSPSIERLASMVSEAEGFDLCLGYAGWGPGQLEEEIERGSWLAIDADPGIIFETPIGERYEKALGLLGLTPATIWMQPINE